MIDRWIVGYAQCSPIIPATGFRPPCFFYRRPPFSFSPAENMLRPRTPVAALAVRALHAARPLARRRAADCIAVSNLQLECIVGIYAHERAALQPLRLDVELEVDMTPPTIPLTLSHH